MLIIVSGVEAAAARNGDYKNNHFVIWGSGMRSLLTCVQHKSLHTFPPPKCLSLRKFVCRKRGAHSECYVRQGIPWDFRVYKWRVSTWGSWGGTQKLSCFSSKFQWRKECSLSCNALSTKYHNATMSWPSSDHVLARFVYWAHGQVTFTCHVATWSPRPPIYGQIINSTSAAHICIGVVQTLALPSLGVLNFSIG